MDVPRDSVGLGGLLKGVVSDVIRDLASIPLSAVQGAVGIKSKTRDHSHERIVDDTSGQKKEEESTIVDSLLTTAPREPLVRKKGDQRSYDHTQDSVMPVHVSDSNHESSREDIDLLHSDRDTLPLDAGIFDDRKKSQDFHAYAASSSKEREPRHVVYESNTKIENESKKEDQETSEGYVRETLIHRPDLQFSSKNSTIIIPMQDSHSDTQPQHGRAPDAKEVSTLLIPNDCDKNTLSIVDVVSSELRESVWYGYGTTSSV